MIPGKLTRYEESRLREAIKHAAALQMAAMNRMLADGNDDHPNSWWRHCEKEMKSLSESISHNVEMFLKRNQPSGQNKEAKHEITQR